MEAIIRVQSLIPVLIIHVLDPAGFLMYRLLDLDGVEGTKGNPSVLID